MITNRVLIRDFLAGRDVRAIARHRRVPAGHVEKALRFAFTRHGRKP